MNSQRPLPNGEGLFSCGMIFSFIQLSTISMNADTFNLIQKMIVEEFPKNLIFGLMQKQSLHISIHSHLHHGGWPRQ